MDIITEAQQQQQYQQQQQETNNLEQKEEESFTHIEHINEPLLQKPPTPNEVDDDENIDMTITKELRQATKDVHKISDVLVNAKFALALSDDAVWFDGLLAFHEIYKFFENNLPVDLLPKELHRSKEFEKDLAFYYGRDWKINYQRRESVNKYLNHLEAVTAKSNILLFAYAFQMYMALMSGGQLLQRKRMIARKIWRKNADAEETSETAATSKAAENADELATDDLQARPMPVQVDICPEGCAATYFPERIPKLKAKLRKILNLNYANFDEETRIAFINESRNVFKLNCDVVRSIRGVNSVGIRKLAIVVIFALGIYFAIKVAKN